MVISVQPIYELLKEYDLLGKAHIVLLCPRGDKLTQTKSRELEKISESKPIVLICGHYEGIDERIKHFVSESLSIGDYIISSGTLAASIVLESVVRLVPNVISEESLVSESFNSEESSADLDFPVYTQPKEFLGLKVPEILLKGDHTQIQKFRDSERKPRTTTIKKKK
ncbi:tRNA (guanine-N(1)-)-methyltransferase [Candidatus Mycoplasma haematolamae str. Purdue]|uniref:tRNA (guanine-N(1)-)-methyltransferase n=1 Tax=Mycoplasma haematolamae (strain Purdue) TaxID=1212765 RepID=I7CFU8_MYCHA|nr:tRNA (guanine-N1)-methyltransferase [Candidatus Mycoplasma haematolamae]AFO52096.1 tRNA (guanine-N(1)-)-methyltransferase [Candidatus Mycoplasma haematolamae str. Purdue]